jgi:hypothetical protein
LKKIWERDDPKKSRVFVKITKTNII